MLEIKWPGVGQTKRGGGTQREKEKEREIGSVARKRRQREIRGTYIARMVRGHLHINCPPKIILAFNFPLPSGLRASVRSRRVQPLRRF